MSKGIYVGVGGVARKCKPYIGVGGVAKKVKKGYVGVGGVPRLMFSLGMERVASVTSISPDFIYSDACNNTVADKYMIFQSNNGSKILAFSSNFTKIDTGGSHYYNYGATGRAGGYGLFAGGHSGDTRTDKVTAISPSLVVVTAPVLRIIVNANSGAWTGGWAIFAAGRYDSTGSSKINYADAYSSALVRTPLANLSAYKDRCRAGRVGDYALFAGGTEGEYNTISTSVDAYNSSLVKVVATPLAQGKYGQSPEAGNSKYCLINGMDVNSSYNLLEAYNASLVRFTAATLPSYLRNPALINSPDFAVVAGGKYYDGYSQYLFTSDVRLFDTNLVQTAGPAMIQTANKDYITANFADGAAMIVTGGSVDAYTL